MYNKRVNSPLGKQRPNTQESADENLSNRRAVELLHFAKEHIRNTQQRLPYTEQPSSASPSPVKPGAASATSKLPQRIFSAEFPPPEIYLHRNRYGGIHVDKRDIETLFKFIDPNNYGRVKQSDLKKKVSLFARELRGKDYKLLMTGKNELTISELHDILKNNELENFDPIAEAFRFFDPDGTGAVDMERLREIFLLLGYGDLSYSDMNLILELADADGDHKISLDDFRALIPVYEGEEGSGEEKAGYTYNTEPEIHDLFKNSLKSLIHQMDYLPVALPKFPTRPSPLTAEQRYWRSFRNALLRQDRFKISSVWAGPKFYVVGSEMRFRFFDYSNTARFSIGMFKDNVTVGCFRQDGEMFVGGDAGGRVKMFKTQKKVFLKEFRWKGAVSGVAWADPTTLITGDGSGQLGVWDIASGKTKLSFKAHGQSVSAVSSWGANLAVSGGLDCKVKLWDLRNGEVVQTFQWESAITSVTTSPRALFAAHHCSIGAWEMGGSGEPVATYTPHGKSVSQLLLDDSGTRLISGSFDTTVKFLNPDSLEVMHSVKYPSAVNTLALTNGNVHLIVGMLDGKLSVRQKGEPVQDKTPLGDDELIFPIGAPAKVKNYKWFYRGQYLKSDQSDITAYRKSLSKLRGYDKLLKKFRYGEALDKAIATGRPEVTVAVIGELEQRGGLQAALRNRSWHELTPVLSFLAHKATGAKYRSTALHFLDTFIDMYGCLATVSQPLQAALSALQNSLSSELEIQRKAEYLDGLLSTLIQNGLVPKVQSKTEFAYLEMHSRSQLVKALKQS